MAEGEIESFTSGQLMSLEENNDCLQFIYQVPEHVCFTNLHCVTPVYVMKRLLKTSYSFRGMITRNNEDSLMVELICCSNSPEDVLVTWSAYAYNNEKDTYLPLGESQSLSKQTKEDENNGLCVSMTAIQNFVQKQALVIQWNVKFLLRNPPMTETNNLCTHFDTYDKLISSISKIAAMVVLDRDEKQVEAVHTTLNQCHQQQSCNQDTVNHLETQLFTATGRVSRLSDRVELQEKQVSEVVADIMNVLSLAQENLKTAIQHETDHEGDASNTVTDDTKCHQTSREHLLSMANEELVDTRMRRSRNKESLIETIMQRTIERNTYSSKRSESGKSLCAIGINITSEAMETVSKEIENNAIHFIKTATGNATIKEHDRLSFPRDEELRSISSLGYYSDEEISPYCHHREMTLEHFPVRKGRLLGTRLLKNRKYHSQTNVDEFSPTSRHFYLINSLGETALNITCNSGDLETCHFISLLSSHWEMKQKRKIKIEELDMSLDEGSTQISQLYKSVTHKGFKKKYLNPEVMSGDSCVDQVDVCSIPLDLTNNAGESALSIAAELGDLKVLKTLIRVGAKVTETALLKAVTNQQKACIVKLLRSDAPFNDSLLGEILKFSSETVFKVFLEAERNATCPAENRGSMTLHTLDEPILHKAVRLEITEAVPCLIRAGANVHKRNLRNETALNIAVKLMNMDVIIELLKAEAILTPDEMKIVLQYSKGTEKT